MKYFVFIFTIAVLISGCSSNPPANAPAGANTNQVNANSIAATNPNPSEMTPYNGVQNLNPNAFNATNDNRKVIPYQPKKDELPYGSRYAPDDSVISSGSRGKDFVETRTFKSHDVLNKVEKIMDGKTTKYKVYLKNGKVVDAPAEKMNNFAAMAPVSILEVIGLAPKTQPATEEKKEEKPQ
jgi:hypothetical protein